MRGTLIPKACTREGGILDRGAQIRAELGPLDEKPDGEAERDRGEDHPEAVDRQDHEAEIEAAAERRRRRVRLARAAIEIAKA
jgi:hypothetical protein